MYETDGSLASRSTFLPGFEPALRRHGLVLVTASALFSVVRQTDRIFDWFSEHHDAYGINHLQLKISIVHSIAQRTQRNPALK